MKSTMRTRYSITTCFISLLILSSSSGFSLSTRWEHDEDFLHGKTDSVQIENENIQLGNKEPISNWTRIAYGMPSNRQQSTMVYDSSDDLVVLFGGYGNAAYLNDTWIYNLNSNNWSKRFPLSSPPARYGHSMAFDTVNREVILFGGWIPNSPFLCFNDTWTFNLSTNKWTKKNPQISPPPRADFGMTYDGSNGLIVLFGGYSITGGDYNDTWVYDLSIDTWTEKHPNISPSPGIVSSLVYDILDRVNMCFKWRIAPERLNETWLYDVNKDEWTIKLAESAPSARVEYSTIYDYKNSCVVFFGGATSDDNYNNDTWSYNINQNKWTNVTTNLAPSSRSSDVMIYDIPAEVSLLFGGMNQNSIKDDLWMYNSSSNLWKEILPIPAPFARETNSLVYDPQTKDFFLFGGFGEHQAGSSNDLWAYNFSRAEWTEKKPLIKPYGRIMHSMTYQTDKHVAILFGGMYWNWNSTNGMILNDTWGYDPIANAWLNLTPKSSPPARFGQSMCYDSRNGVIVMFGGFSYDELFNDTWIYNMTYNSWTNMSAKDSPPSRYGHSMAYDPINEQIILFGGIKNDSTVAGFNDTWIYDLQSNTWTRVNTGSAPSPRCFSSMIYDVSIAQFVLFGGGNYSCDYNDMWFFNTNIYCWTRSSINQLPQARSDCSMGYDLDNGIILLFGGESKEEQNHLGDTWTLDLKRQFYPSGQYYSNPYDSEGKAYYGRIQWNSLVPPGTSIVFQFRTADTISQLNQSNFIGPDGTLNSYYLFSGQIINTIHNGSRWMQYCAYLASSDRSNTPVLSSVSVDFNLLQYLRIDSPMKEAIWTGWHNISWNASDSDNDLLNFDIYLKNNSGCSLLVSNLSNETHKWTWNTSLVPNGTYRIIVIARDNNPSIPLTVNAISDNFSIFHPPPPNRLPHVNLVSPLNNSIVNNTTVHLIWTGTDLDGDPLIYTCLLSNSSYMQDAINFYFVTDQFITLLNLSDNTTYYWTINATDGITNSTDVPTEIWRFTVRLPKINHPPRITSNPPSSAQVGETYDYNMTVIDEDNDTISFSIVQAPNNISFNSNSGRMQWVPTISEVGNHSIMIRASDNKGGVDEQAFTITVIAKPPPIKPLCNIIFPTNGSKVSDRVQVRGTALNGTYQLLLIQTRIDGGIWLYTTGLENWSYSFDLGKLKNGNHIIEARAFDGVLYSDQASIVIKVQNPDPKVWVEQAVWWMPIVIIFVIAIIGIVLFKRKRPG